MLPGFPTLGTLHGVFFVDKKKHLAPVGAVGSPWVPLEQNVFCFVEELNAP